MALEVEGKLIKILPERSGTSSAGKEWKSQDFVIEIPGQYPTQVCFSLWGDKISIKDYQIGENIRVSFDIRSREWQDKWFTTLSPWKIDRVGAVSQQNSQQPSAPAEAPLSKSED